MNSHLPWQNILKNILIVVIAIFLWPVLSRSLQQIQADQIGNFLTIISIMLVTVCFANFAFTYEKSRMKTSGGALFSHSATFCFMLLIVLSLESMVLAVKAVYPSFYLLFLWFAALLYIGIVLYDFWDYFRAQ